MKILLPIDGSDQANNTVDWVIRYLDSKNAQVYLLIVIDKAQGYLKGIHDLISHAEGILHEAKAVLQDKGFDVVSCDHRFGIPGLAIVHYADEKDIDQIILGSHGLTGIKKVLMGSVSSLVLEHCDREVTVLNNRVTHPRNALHLDA